MEERDKSAKSLLNTSVDSVESLIAFMERSDDFWLIKDIESRYIFANSVSYYYGDLPKNFDIEGRLDQECPAYWSEQAPLFQENERVVRTTGKKKNILNTFIFGGREKRVQAFLGDVFPLYKNGECIGTVSYLKRLTFYSMHHYTRGEYPSELTLNKPDCFFTDREFDVLFFVLQGMKPKEIALRLALSNRTVTNKLQMMYQKAQVNSLGALKEFCLAKGYDRYAPSKFVNPQRFIVL
ncbi:helix-turn-helix transcriptional regulator [Acerihabitans sp. TG2]|uniref:helix-turn-helix transcriptional regulator n=1 Tax=Acerihabitans sp. TG2 TaxID=3096008 RepID=UPI002B224508|nr:helix-turn-helix transcriptional regulator [Acerihabitans sp. TG2]MEA9391394.1 helix-turn-helix transcriptional regulator [Acerihabitans sp. TG2]